MNRILKTLVLAGSLLAIASITTGQSALKLSTGQKYEMVMQNKMNMTQDMNGQVQEVKSDNSTTRLIEVKDVNSTGYTFSNTFAKLKMTSSSMAGDVSFDSENAADKESETGKELGKNVGKTIEVTTDAGGKVTAVKRENNEEAGGLQAMMQLISGSTPDGGIAQLLIQLPSATPKTGDTWTDSTISQGVKTIHHYSVKSAAGNDITVDINDETSLATEFEQGGMTINVTVSTTTKGEAVYEVATGMLKQKNTVTEGSGIADVSGMMQIPITINRTSSVNAKKL